jgi:hypothetical protein
MWLIEVEYMDGKKRTYKRDVILQNGVELKLVNINPDFKAETDSVWNMHKDGIYIPFVVIREYRATLKLKTFKEETT